MDEITTDGLDFLLSMYHFSKENFERVVLETKVASAERQLPILVASLVSDRNNGFSSYVRGDAIVSTPDDDGILETEF